jgi:hypothetical protein
MNIAAAARPTYGSEKGIIRLTIGAGNATFNYDPLCDESELRSMTGVRKL